MASVERNVNTDPFVTEFRQRLFGLSCETERIGTLVLGRIIPPGLVEGCAKTIRERFDLMVLQAAEFIIDSSVIVDTRPGINEALGVVREMDETGRISFDSSKRFLESSGII
ncbi:MAG: hypothetical protein Q7S45_02685 [Candidatus Curtissbacteria bacterium]|nr:hypothetical protein [Candidatus Curtissbacteria bacterium]